MTDKVELSFPRDSRYYAVASLVVGGMAAPMQMSIDALDDLQLAISSLLDHQELRLATGNDVQLRIEVSADRLTAELGGFAAGSASGVFSDGSDDNADEGLGLKRLLNTIVDELEIKADQDSAGEWISLTKVVKAVA